MRLLPWTPVAIYLLGETRGYQPHKSTRERSLASAATAIALSKDAVGFSSFPTPHLVL